MSVYFGSFALCEIISLLINHKGNKTKGFLIGSVSIVIILSLVAGLRSSSVGTDTAGYALNLYDLACEKKSFISFYSSSWYRVWRWVNVNSFEIGYLLIVWIARKLGSFQFLLFINSILIVGPFYYALAKKKDELYIPICLAFYMLVYFNVSLNLMRQCVAVSFVFLAVVALYNPKKSMLQQQSAYVSLLIALLFHSSAIIGLVPFLIRAAVKDERGFIRYCVIIGISIVLILSLGIVRDFLNFVGLSRFAAYLGNGSISFLPMSLIRTMPFLILAIYLYQSKKTDMQKALFYLCMTTLSVFASQLASLWEQSGRITAYIDFFEISLIGLTISCLTKRMPTYKKSSFLMQPVSSFLVGVFAVTYGLIYWFYVYGAGSSETLPYLFFWQ